MMSEHWSWKSAFMPDGEPIPGKTYRADGWQYVDLPTRLSHEMKDVFFGVIGDGNYVILAETIVDGLKGYWRGQLLISPEGQARMLAHSKTEAA